MMRRIPEKELMDGAAQARAYAEADFEEPHSAFIRAFEESFPGLEVSGAVLDLGCGPGDISIRFARRFPAVCVCGVDGSDAMLAEGRRLLAGAADVAGRVELVRGMLPGAVLPQKRYGCVISNSLLHHLDDPMVLWSTALSCTGAGAPVFVMDLMRPSGADEAVRLTDIYMAGEPDILREDFYRSLLAAYRPEEVERQLLDAGLEGFRTRIMSDRHLAVWGRCPADGREP